MATDPDSTHSIAVDSDLDSFSWGRQFQFMLKELRETLRDRRTTITLLAMPLLLYPLLGIGFRFFALQEAPKTELTYRVSVQTEQEGNWLLAMLQLGEESLARRTAEFNPLKFELFVLTDEGDSNLDSVVADSSVDLGIRVSSSEQRRREAPETVQVELLFAQESDVGREAAVLVERRLAAANVAILRRRVERLSAEFAVPIVQRRVQVGSAESGSTILGILPIVLLLMTVTGGVYPAIDLTAGERERNTLETLMALPIPRFRLLLAKYVAVVTVTLLTGLMNLVAMSVTLYALQLDSLLLGDGGFTLGLAAKLFLALLAFALFYSAVLLLLTSSAKSFKEAQAYLIPLLLISIAPSLLLLMPGWSLSNGTASIPLVNMLLLTKDLLEGTLQVVPAVLAVLSTILYGLAALALAAQVFGNDSLTVGSRGRWNELLQRPVSNARQSPSVADSLIALAILFPAYFVTSGVLSRGNQFTPDGRLMLSALSTIVLFVGVPCLLLRWNRLPFAAGLQLTSVRPISLFAALLLGLSCWPWFFEMIVVLQSLGIRSIDVSQIEEVESLLAGWKSVPLGLIVLTLGIVPGVCEECFFRGFLLHGLLQSLRPAAAITISAIAFGLFHVILAGGAAPERLLPSTCMGVLLGWVAWQSSSIVTSILLHCVHNSSLLLMAHFRGDLAKWNLGQPDELHLPIAWLAGAAAMFLFGIFLLKPRGGRRSKDTSQA